MLSAEKPAVEKVGPVQVEGTAGEVQLALPPKTGEPIFPGPGVSTKGQKHNFLGEAEPANMSESHFLLLSVAVLTPENQHSTV